MGTSNQTIEPGSAAVASPYIISGRSGTLTGLSAANPVACLINFGMLTEQGLVNTPIRIAQIRLKYGVMTTPATNGVFFELLKGTATTQHSSGGNTFAPQRRKTSNYDDIPSSQVSLYVSGTGAISGGNFAPIDAAAPFDMLSAGGSTGLDGGELIWSPSDLSPIQLEKGEAIEVRVRGFSGTGILLSAFDFLR